MNKQIEQLKATFHEIFQTDQAELDFGIYRIMRQKSAEFDAYLEGQLMTDLRQSFQKWQAQTSEDLQRQLTEAVNGAIALGFDPDTSPKVKELRETLEAIKHRESLEESVLSDLVQFLGRYYKEGDFLSLPRYRKNSYAIEYNGEEVKLHWANADQYYVKTAERFRDYRFLLPDGKAVHFKITAANTETGNNKTEAGKERRFQLVENDFMREEAGELFIFFRYETDEGKRKREEINAETARRILHDADGFLEWRKALGESAPTDKNGQRTLLDKRLNEYTAKNTFDYFIHKDLETFLRRELDFFIKNEIVRLDDIENEDAPRVELYLAKVKALRRVGHKLISFLAQVENFQKKLFLKKKFVIRANYCMTLDRVPRELWADVLANAAQVEEWRRLYAIDEIEGDLLNGNAGENEQFLEANQNLIIDTRHFPEEWKLKLLANFDDLDAVTGGLLIKADNFHALNLLGKKYRESVKCIYIDPPYNAKASEILYKNNYKHSSWLALMQDRIFLGSQALDKEGVLVVAIDENEQERLGILLELLFPQHKKTCVTVVHNPGGIQGTNFSYSHEYAYFIFPSNGKYIGTMEREEADIVPLRDWGGDESKRETARNCFYPIYAQGNIVIDFGDVCAESFHPEQAVVEREDGVTIIYPIDSAGVERKWRFARQSVEKIKNNLTCDEVNGEKVIRRHKSEYRYKTVWTDKKYNSNAYGAKLLGNMLPENNFDFPKSLHTVEDSIIATTQDDSDAVILDFFGGSGTTAHAVIKLNREDGGTRKYILVETNEYFDSVTLPRVKKVIYAKEWKDGKPVKREGSSHVLKYFALESYEDAMNNLVVNRTAEQDQGLLKFTNEFREDYLLNYMLEFEAQGSQSLLNLDNFAAPFDYRMKIAVNGVGETQTTPVDLVETFNYLIGLRVEKMQQIDGFRTLRGTTRKGERCLILWRTTKELAQELADKRLNDFLAKQSFDFSEIDTLYINGDAAIPIGNVRKEADTWQIKMIEAEFMKRMFSE